MHRRWPSFNQNATAGVACLLNSPADTPLTNWTWQTAIQDDAMTTGSVDVRGQFPL